MRIDSVVVGAVGLLLAAGSTMQLLAALYGGHAERNLDRPDSERTLRAAQLAAQIKPWSARYHALYGWTLNEQERGAEADHHYQRALLLAPADALLWTEYAQALTRSDRFDRLLESTTRRAQSLAPFSTAVQGTIAELGLSYWHRGSAALRELWLLSMRFERDRHRFTFLGRAITRGRVGTFCADAAMRLGEQPWCEGMQRRAEACNGGADPEDYALCVLQR